MFFRQWHLFLAGKTQVCLHSYLRVHVLVALAPYSTYSAGAKWHIMASGVGSENIVYFVATENPF